MNYSPWGHKELDTTEGLHFHFQWLSGKESTCRAGDVDLIPRSGRSAGEGKGSTLQHPCREIPWIEEAGGSQSTGSQNSATAEQQCSSCHPSGSHSGVPGAKPVSAENLLERQGDPRLL